MARYLRCLAFMRRKTVLLLGLPLVIELFSDIPLPWSSPIVTPIHVLNTAYQPVFRLGSGAGSVSHTPSLRGTARVHLDNGSDTVAGRAAYAPSQSTTVPTREMDEVGEPRQLKIEPNTRIYHVPNTQRLLSDPLTRIYPIVKNFVKHHIPQLALLMFALYLVSLVPPHHHGGGHHHRGGMELPSLQGGSFNYRIPPSWSPENESNYSFRAFATDLTLWTMLTDLQEHQQAASLIMRLGGTAREVARTLSIQEITQGGPHPVTGQQLAPVAYIIAGLEMRYAQLADETRLAAVSEFMAFSRRPNETINELLTRYDLVRQRAQGDGNFVMSVEGCALMLMRCCHVNNQQFIQFLQPFGGRLPTNDAEFRDLTHNMRRIGHILEHSPNNIAMGLHGQRQARPGAYVTAAQDAFERTNSETTQAFMVGGYGGQADAAFNAAQPRELDATDWAYLSGGAHLGNTPPVWGSHGQDHLVDSSGPPSLTNTSDTEYAFLAEGDDVESLASQASESTLSDTSSDSGHEPIAFDDVEPMNDQDALEHVFLQYRHAKRRWRRYTQRPVRKYRRVLKFMKRRKYHHSTRGRGHSPRFNRSGGSRRFGFGNNTSGGRSHHRRRFHRRVYLGNDEIQAYLRNKGKGHRANTTGKGHGRKGNPRGKDGVPLLCRICQSPDHFQAKCPQNTGGGKGKGKSGGLGKGGPPMPSPPTFATDVPPTDSTSTGWSYNGNFMASNDLSTQEPEAAGPLDDLLNQALQLGTIPDQVELAHQSFMVADAPMPAASSNQDPWMSQRGDPWRSGRTSDQGRRHTARSRSPSGSRADNESDWSNYHSNVGSTHTMNLLLPTTPAG